MSERFVVFVESKDTCNLYDEETHCFYEIHDNERNISILCERLNALVDENNEYHFKLSLERIKVKNLENEIEELKKKKGWLQQKLDSTTMLNDDYEELIEEFEDIVCDNIENVIDRMKENRKVTKDKIYYWQCKYYKKDYEHKQELCSKKHTGTLLDVCLKDKCDKMVKRDCEVTITEFENGMSITWKKGEDMR